MSTREPEPVRLLMEQAISTHEAVAAQLRLSPSDLRCLNLVASEPDMTPSRLAELSGLTAGAITGVLDRLEADGFVRRLPDASDRRRSTVELDPQRWADVDRAYEPLVQRAHSLSHGVDAGLRRELERYLADLTSALGEEAMRLWAATRGGLVDGVYLAPVVGATNARLILATGAPRVNVSRAALGQRLLLVAETAATRLRLKPAVGDDRLITGHLRRSTTGHQERCGRGRDALSPADDRRAQPRNHRRAEPRGGLDHRDQRRDHRSRSRS